MYGANENNPETVSTRLVGCHSISQFANPMSKLFQKFFPTFICRIHVGHFIVLIQWLSLVYVVSFCCIQGGFWMPLFLLARWVNSGGRHRIYTHILTFKIVLYLLCPYFLIFFYWGYLRTETRATVQDDIMPSHEGNMYVCVRYIPLDIQIGLYMLLMYTTYVKVNVIEIMYWHEVGWISSVQWLNPPKNIDQWFAMRLLELWTIFSHVNIDNFYLYFIHCFLLLSVNKIWYFDTSLSSL